MQSRNFLFSPLVLIALFILAAMQPVAGQKTRPLQKAVEDFSANPLMENAAWGFMVMDVQSGKEILSVSPNLSLIPASAQKAMTTLTSLALLGTDYRFETLIQYDGHIENGILHGNLYITGTGDPTLGATQLHDSLELKNTFSAWLSDIRSSGITAVKGNIIADGSYFDKHMIPPKWMWEDIGNYYGAGAHALTVHENMYTVFFEPATREGAPARVNNTTPTVPEMDFINDVSTGPRGSGDRVYIYGVPGQDTRWLTGTVPLGQSNFAVRGSLPDPGKYLARVFAEFLKNEQITVEGHALTHQTAQNLTPAENRVILSRWLSPTLADITQRTNMASVNTYAENLIKTLGQKFKGEGSYSKGAEVITEFWEERGINVTGLRVHDGSGLSPFNSITVSQLTQMMVFAASDDALHPALTKGFPIAGESGSLARMFLNSPSRGVLTAKSGFLGNVRAYTGYTQSRKGKLLAFTLIVNNYPVTGLELRHRMEELMDAIGRIE